jgi:hypothetical protein
MEFVQDTLLVLHFIGLAALFGGFFVQLRTSPKVVNAAMLHGALTQLVTGILLFGGLYGLDEEPNHPKIATKFVILLIITGLAWANRKKESVSTGVWAGIGALTVVNIILAVFW